MVTTDMLQLGHYMSWKHFVTSEITNGDTLSPQNNASGKWSEQETNSYQEYFLCQAYLYGILRILSQLLSV